MWRLFILFGAGLAAVLAVVSGSAGRSATSLTLLHEGNPPQLVVPGDPTEVEYVIGTAGVTEPTGTFYVRRDGQSGFKALPLQLGFASGRRPRLHLTVPAHFLRGKRLFYYAQLRDPESGASITVPTKGARAPQASWILHRPTVVRLGPYRFGHPEAAQAVVARAAATSVGWDRAFQRGPNTFLVGRDRSIWLEDTWKQRMLVWAPGRPNKPVRTVPLPTEGRHDVAFEDVAFGPRATLYVTRIRKAVPGFQLFRINAKTGKVLWKSSSPDLWQRFPSSGVALRVGSDGILYGHVDAAGIETIGTPEYGWMPLATRTGKPLPAAQQSKRILWGYEPAPSGRRFVAEPYVPPHWRYLPREWRFATISRYGRLSHAWRITSKAAVGGWYLWPQLLDGSVVADLAPVAGPGTLEHFFVRLDREGLDAKASLPYRISGDCRFTDVRVGPDGRIYQLATSPATGIVIRRYALGR